MRRMVLVGMISSVLAFAPIGTQAQQKFVLGIMPVYDQSAEDLTEFLPYGLTMLLYKHLRASAEIEPMLLSPGGLYDPSSNDWNQEFGRKAHADAILISRIYKSTRVNDRKRLLKVSFQLMNVKTGAIGPEMTNAEVEVKTTSLLGTVVDTANTANTSVGSYISSQSSGFWRPSEDFEKQPVGKASAQLADWAIARLPASLQTQGVAQSGTTPSSPAPASCKVIFKVRYVAKHSIAKGYTVFANDEDETSTIADGIATFRMPTGLVVMRVQLPDPPYGIPTQKLYQSSTTGYCDGTVHTLNFDVGVAGEGLLHWD